MIIQINVIEERDGWTWHIEQQDGCLDGGGVDIVYQEDGGTGSNDTRTCIGSLDDAEALAKAILAYVELARKEKKQ